MALGAESGGLAALLGQPQERDRPCHRWHASQDCGQRRPAETEHVGSTTNPAPAHDITDEVDEFLGDGPGAGVNVGH
ncbi:MAG TPA: hypothetical protein VI197_07250 [Polyangiaceae bacterium]